MTVPAILPRTAFAVTFVAGIVAIVPVALRAEENGDVATQLLCDVEDAVRAMETIPEPAQEERLREWALQQGLFSELARIEATFGRYDAAREFVDRIHLDDSRFETFQELGVIAAGRGEQEEVIQLVRSIPAFTNPESKSRNISYFLSGIAIGGHQDAAVALLRRYKPVLQRQHASEVYSTLASTAATREASKEFAEASFRLYDFDARGAGAGRGLYIALLAAGRCDDADQFARGRLSQRTQDDAADWLAYQLAQSCRLDDAITVAERISEDNSLVTWWPDSVLIELHARGAIRADDVDAILSKVRGDYAKDEALYYGSLAALKEDRPGLIAKCAERASEPWSYTRIVCDCLAHGDDQSGAIIEALGGESRVLEKASRAGNNCHAAAVASLAIALAASGRQEIARDYFDIAVAQFRLTLNDYEVDWEDRYLEELDLHKKWRYFARAAVALGMQSQMKDVLRAREASFGRSRYKIGSFFYQVELWELLDIADTWSELGELDEVERLCRNEDREYRFAIIRHIVEKRATKDNAQSFVALIDHIETAEWNALMKLELIKALSKPRPACDE